MSETNETLSDQDVADLASIGISAEGATKRSLLTIWTELLSNVEKNAENPIPAPVAAKVVASWPFLSFQETAQYHRVYHDILLECRDELREIVAENPDALDWTGEEDGQENHELYREVLVRWHMLLDDHEARWRAEDSDSHIWIAALADARAFFFSQVGLAGHLDTIGFSLTDGEFMAAVTKAREEQGE